jgi:hypothetical protein
MLLGKGAAKRAKKKNEAKIHSHIFGQIFFFIFTLCFGGDRASVDYLHVAERSNYMPAQTINAITAETWGKNEKEAGRKYVSEFFACFRI